jgi:ATP-binding cassette subfamily F protein 3
MSVLSLSGVSVEFGATTLLENVTFTVGAGDRWGVVGRNGTGKTTLFRLITGEQQPTRGVISRLPGLKVSLLEQHRDYGDAATVWEAAAGQFAELLRLEQSLGEQAARMGELGEKVTEAQLARYARDLERFERDGGYTFAPAVDAVLHGLGFDPVEARTRPLAQLSGGERGRVGLARQLVSPADVLLLDEPTNHLDLETTAWLEQWLQSTSKTVVVISHDRAFLEAVVDHVLHLEGRSAFPYTGDYEAFVMQRNERRLAQQRAFDKQQRTIAAEEDYIRRNIAGQNSRQAKGRRTRLARVGRLSSPIGEAGTMALRLEVFDRGGDQVIVAQQATVKVADRVLVERFSDTVNRGEVVGLVGPNGAGKSTLLKALVGDRAADGGILRTGNSIRVAWYRQDLAQVPMGKSLYDIVQEMRPRWERGQIQGHLGRFGFSGEEVLRKADTLSGGERARVALALMMLSGANLLVLDEPTNHLDVESIETLEDAIEGYDGTVLLVSHDRALLRALATRVWVLHERHVTVFDGTFAEWEAASAERAHAAQVQAAEEEGLRRMQERKRTQRQESPKDSQRADARKARKSVDDAEQRVATLEARVAELTTALADPELYTTPEGTQRASRLGKDLDAAKRDLDRALEDWTAATEALEEMGTV